MIGSKFSRLFFNQSEVKPKLIVARAWTFSRALCQLRVITLSFDWFTGLPPSFLIDQSNYVQVVIGFGFPFHWLINWREILKSITKRSTCNRVITFDSHLKTALELNVNMTCSYFFARFSRGLRFYEGLEKTALKLDEKLKNFAERRKKELDKITEKEKAKRANGALCSFAECGRDQPDTFLFKKNLFSGHSSCNL